ncbi:MAG: hypothetical protein ACQERF_00585 [Actinomycetota bacterium]
MAGQDSCSSIEVRICARGVLTEETRRELASFSEAGDGTHLVLRGTVVDQAALVGVLERLWRAGLHIRDVEVIPATDEPGPFLLPVVARLEFRGQVADLLDLVVTEPHTIEATAVTTMEVALRDDAEALFELLARLERISLDIHEVHVRPQRG